MLLEGNFHLRIPLSEGHLSRGRPGAEGLWTSGAGSADRQPFPEKDTTILGHVTRDLSGPHSLQLL